MYAARKRMKCKIKMRNLDIQPEMVRFLNEEAARQQTALSIIQDALGRYVVGRKGLGLVCFLALFACVYVSSCVTRCALDTRLFRMLSAGE
jgi:hypothetical protein